MLFTDCLNSYIQIMEKHVDEKSLSQDKPYFEQIKLLEIHQMAREDATLQVRNGFGHIIQVSCEVVK